MDDAALFLRIVVDEADRLRFCMSSRSSSSPPSPAP
jgi:hypothetical protein